MENMLSVIIAVLELLVLLYYFHDFAPNTKSNLWKRSSWYILIVIISLFAWNIFDNIFIKFIFMDVFLVMVFMQVYKESFWVTELYITTYLLVSLFCEVMIKTNVKALFYKMYTTDPLAFEFTCILFTKFATLILLFFLKKMMQKLVLKKPNIKDLGLILLEVVTDILFFIFVGIFVNNEHRIAKEIASLIMLCTLLILIFFIGSLYYTEYFIKMHHKDMIDEEELALAKMRSEIYKNQIEDADKIRSMYHDMKNHILVLNNEMLEPEGQEKYMSVLQKKIDAFDDYIHTGNQYLDIMLKEKMKDCRGNDITLDAQINLCEISVLNPVEICVLFGNLLDNAIEANRFISDPQKRSIDITAHKKNKSFIIKFVNPTEKPLIWSKKELTTTKKDSACHGFGMKNIKKIVDDKNGQYSIRTENNQFVICIILPLEC